MYRAGIGLMMIAGWLAASPPPARAGQQAPAPASTQTAASTQPAPSPRACPDDGEWNITRKPFRIHGNTYFVGVCGLSAILITSPDGHVLIDGGLAETAPKILDSIRALGFKPEDVKLILNTHAHFDHAGGVADLQRATGAAVAVSPWSAKVFRTGNSTPDDPQYGTLKPITTVARVREIKDGETLRVGPLALDAHFTPGHTPGGTSWSWKSCDDQQRCLDVVYADSLSPISADSFLFTSSRANPHAVQDFEKSFAALSALTCDLLITPHPGSVDLWDRLEKREAGTMPDPLIDTAALRRYVDSARERLTKRIAEEKAKSSRR